MNLKKYFNEKKLVKTRQITFETKQKIAHQRLKMNERNARINQKTTKRREIIDKAKRKENRRHEKIKQQNEKKLLILQFQLIKVIDETIRDESKNENENKNINKNKKKNYFYN